MGRLFDGAPVFPALLAIGLSVPHPPMWGAQHALRRDATPAWVDELTFNARAAGAGPNSGSVEYLLIDRQDDARSAQVEAYVHIAKRVLNRQGVATESQIAIDFDPTFQEVVVHHVAVHRVGQRIDQLETNQFRLIDSEPLLQQQMLSGTRTALLVLTDVRSGDVIEFSYTTRGRSPVYGQKYFGAVVLRMAAPIERLHFRIVRANEDGLHLRSHGLEVQPQIRDEVLGRELVWDFGHADAVLFPDDAPSWFESAPWIEVSEFGDWGEVARWGAELFQAPSAVGPEIRALVQEFRAVENDPREQVRRVLRYVQSEIRHLAMSFGESACRPSSPDEVLARRYGDCKDKVLLFATVLRELGIEVQPALVNTVWRHAIESWLPSPAAFDHVIARVELGGEEIWVDPTIASERGPLSEQALADFGRALVLCTDAVDLAHVVRDLGKRPKTSIEKLFRVQARGAASLTIERTYEGADANSMRSYLECVSREEISGDALDACAREYVGARIKAPLEVQDLQDLNRIVVREQYSIPKLWTHVEKDGTWARFWANEIDWEFATPGDMSRTTPMALSHPLHIQWKAIVVLPNEYSIKPEQLRVRNQAIHFDRRLTYANRRLELSLDYHTMSDHVGPADCARYASDLAKVRANLGYEISAPRAAPVGGSTAFQSRSELLGFVSMLACVGALGWYLRHGSRQRRGFDPSLRPACDAQPLACVAPDPAIVSATRCTIGRRGDVLIVGSDVAMPARCVICNREAKTNLRREVMCYSPWLVGLLIFGWVGIEIARFAGQRGVIEFGLCPEHHRSRTQTIRTSWTLAFVGIGVGLAGIGICITAPQAGIVGVLLVLLGFVVFIFAAVCEARVCDVLRPIRIHSGCIELKGAGSKFLRSLEPSSPA